MPFRSKDVQVHTTFFQRVHMQNVHNCFCIFWGICMIRSMGKRSSRSIELLPELTGKPWALKIIFCPTQVLCTRSIVWNCVTNINIIANFNYLNPSNFLSWLIFVQAIRHAWCRLSLKIFWKYLIKKNLSISKTKSDLIMKGIHIMMMMRCRYFCEDLFGGRLAASFLSMGGFVTKLDIFFCDVIIKQKQA